MGLLEYKFTLSQYINQMLLVTYIMFLLTVSLNAGSFRDRSKPTSTMCYGVFYLRVIYVTQKVVLLDKL